MKYFKFTNKSSGATGVLPEATINKILANPKQAKIIEVLYECNADGGPVEIIINQNDNSNEQKEKSNEDSTEPAEQLQSTSNESESSNEFTNTVN